MSRMEQLKERTGLFPVVITDIKNEAIRERLNTFAEGYII